MHVEIYRNIMHTHFSFYKNTLIPGGGALGQKGDGDDPPEITTAKKMETSVCEIYTQSVIHSALLLITFSFIPTDGETYNQKSTPTQIHLDGGINLNYIPDLDLYCKAILKGVGGIIDISDALTKQVLNCRNLLTRWMYTFSMNVISITNVQCVYVCVCVLVCVCVYACVLV